jgi:hypothetical protein
MPSLPANSARFGRPGVEFAKLPEVLLGGDGFSIRENPRSTGLHRAQFFETARRRSDIGR